MLYTKIWWFNTKKFPLFYKGISIVSWNVLSLQAWDIWKLSGGKAHYDYDYCYNLHFFVLCEISSAVENYFQKVFSLPTEKPTLPFLLTPPLKIQKVSASPPFFANIENFSGPPAESGEDTVRNPWGLNGKKVNFFLVMAL